VWRLAFAALAACGRFGFEAHPPADAIDAPSIDAPSCGVKQIAAGRYFTCEIDKHDAVWCWGFNDFGQAGPGGPGVVATAQQIVLPGAAAQVSTGRDFACARLVNGDVWCWGENNVGQLGGAAGMGPVQVPLGGETALEVHAGTHQACIRRASDQAIMCWGGNEQFALGNAGASTQAPVVVAGSTGATSLIVAHHGGCYTDAAGGLWCWGSNRANELAAIAGDQAAPLMIAGLPPVSRAARTGQNGCALDGAGDLRCWGQGAEGQLGIGTFITQASPTGVIASNVRDVQLRPFGGWILHTDGTLTAAGIAEIDGRQDMQATLRPASLTGVTQLAAGYHHTCVLVDGNPMCWGANDNGELGRGAAAFAKTPVTMSLAADRVSVTNRTVCAHSGTDAYCWGVGNNAQLGTGMLESTMSPVRVPTGLSTVDGVTAGWVHGCAWGGGALACWGSDNTGQLGDGMFAPSDVAGKPPLIAISSGVTSAQIGYDHTCAIVGTKVQCWGANYDGQLGDGTNTTQLTPVTVIGVTSPTVLAGKYQSTCAIAAGNAFCWGWNGFGQLGDGTTTDRNTAVQPALPGAVADIRPAEDHTCALLTNGDVYCWGANFAGEVGQGDYVEHDTPGKVALPAAASLLATGYFGACARLTTGDVYCWGNYGLGFNMISPTIVPELQNATAIDLENGSGCAAFGTTVKCWGEQEYLGTGDTSPWTPMLATVGCVP